MSDSEKKKEEFEGDKTRIYVPGQKKDYEGENRTDTEKESPKPMTPEEASASYVRHAQEEKGTAAEEPKKDFVFCTKCGTKNRAGAKFCIHCGNPLQNQYQNGPQTYSQQSYQNEPRPSSQNQYQNGPRPSSYQGYQNGPRSSSYQGHQNGPRPSSYQEYQNGPQPYPYQGYQNGPRPSGNVHQNGQHSYSNVMKLIFTAVICVSALIALLGTVVRQSATMSYYRSQLLSELPTSLDDAGELGNAVPGIADMITQFRNTAALLGKSGYNAINFARLEHSMSETFDSITELTDTMSSLSADSTVSSVTDTLRSIQRASMAGFIIELVLMAATAGFSVFSVYTVLKSGSAAKRRGVLSILAGVDLVYMIAHLVIVGLTNSGFARIWNQLAGLGEISSSQYIGNMLNASVGILILPLLFTVVLIILDVVLSKRTSGRAMYR